LLCVEHFHLPEDSTVLGELDPSDNVRRPLERELPIGRVVKLAEQPTVCDRLGELSEFPLPHFAWVHTLVLGRDIGAGELATRDDPRRTVGTLAGTLDDELNEVDALDERLPAIIAHDASE
jgi:hypothetical protein